MRKDSRLRFLGVSLFVVSLFCASACRRQTEPAPQQPEYTPTATVKDLMDAMVDPSADVVWDAVATESGKDGLVDRVPKNDEEWANVRHGAIRLVEAGNLLLMPGRHVARPGEKSEAPGVELEGEQMEALIHKDWGAWLKRVKAFHEAGLAVLQSIDAKDPKALFDVGGQLEMACEGCHTQYWYPNQPLPPGYGSSQKTSQ
jgi:hypothetical protein